MQTFAIEKFDGRTKTYRRTKHTREAVSASAAVKSFVVSCKRCPKKGYATAKSGKKYRAVAI